MKRLSVVFFTSCKTQNILPLKLFYPEYLNFLCRCRHRHLHIPLAPFMSRNRTFSKVHRTTLVIAIARSVSLDPSARRTMTQISCPIRDQSAWSSNGGQATAQAFEKESDNWTSVSLYGFRTVSRSMVHNTMAVKKKKKITHRLRWLRFWRPRSRQHLKRDNDRLQWTFYLYGSIWARKTSL